MTAKPTDGARGNASKLLPGSIVSADGGQPAHCMDVDGCQQPKINTGVVMWPCGTANGCNYTNERWTLEPSGQLSTDMSPGKLCLEAPGMLLAVCDASNPMQKWAVNANGTITTSGMPGKCLDLPSHGPPPAPPPPGQHTLNNHSIAIQINGNVSQETCGRIFRAISQDTVPTAAFDLTLLSLVAAWLLLFTCHIYVCICRITT
jgi:hypothetical protein